MLLLIIQNKIFELLIYYGKFKVILPDQFSGSLQYNATGRREGKGLRDISGMGEGMMQLNSNIKGEKCHKYIFSAFSLV